MDVEVGDSIRNTEANITATSRVFRMGLNVLWVELGGWWVASVPSSLLSLFARKQCQMPMAKPVKWCRIVFNDHHLGSLCTLWTAGCEYIICPTMQCGRSFIIRTPEFISGRWWFIHGAAEDIIQMMFDLNENKQLLMELEASLRYFHLVLQLLRALYWNCFELSSPA
jgi:hypothetical protein